MNNVTSDVHDEDTLCPEFKITAVDIEKVYDEPGRQVNAGNFMPTEIFAK